MVKPRETIVVIVFLGLILLFAGVSWRQRTRFLESAPTKREQHGHIDVILVDPQSKIGKLRIDVKEGTIRHSEPDGSSLQLPRGSRVDRCFGEFAPPVQSPDGSTLATCKSSAFNQPDTLVISNGGAL